MATTDKQKQSLYFPEDTLREIMLEANRLDRSLSWMVQQAWRLAREQLRKVPSLDHSAAAAVERSPRPEPRRDDSERGLPSVELREFLRGKFDRELTS